MPKANVHNDYNIDRVAQKNFTYTGIKTFPLQDIAMMENQWGPIADRKQEHLTSTDYHDHPRPASPAEGARRRCSTASSPTSPWHPEAYAYRRETAQQTEGTLEDVIAKRQGRGDEHAHGATREVGGASLRLAQQRHLTKEASEIPRRLLFVPTGT